VGVSLPRTSRGAQKKSRSRQKTRSLIDATSSVLQLAMMLELTQFLNPSLDRAYAPTQRWRPLAGGFRASSHKECRSAFMFKVSESRTGTLVHGAYSFSHPHRVSTLMCCQALRLSNLGRLRLHWASTGVTVDSCRTLGPEGIGRKAPNVGSKHSDSLLQTGLKLLQYPYVHSNLLLSFNYH